MRIIRELNNNPGTDYPNGSKFGIYSVDTDNVIIGFRGEGKYNDQIEYRGVVIENKGTGYRFGYNSRYWGSRQFHRKKGFEEIETITIPTKKKMIYYSKNFRQLLIIKPRSIIFIRKNHIIEYAHVFGNYDRDILKINGHLYKRVKKENLEFRI